jgi:hypothetical protein
MLYLNHEKIKKSYLQQFQIENGPRSGFHSSSTQFTITQACSDFKLMFCVACPGT